ncbi:MAG TPA: riboflavin synthase [Candidatus Binatia bacterium]|nr:riboflavin synthase [Candidatus Binatia bacterium]
MFTGIVTAMGRIARVERRGGDLRCGIAVPAGFLRGTAAGDSIAVSGVCLTVVAKSARAFTADLSVETLQATTAGHWRSGTPVNLETALTAGTPLGGHLVSGHVDGVGRLRARRDEARSVRLQFESPAALGRYVARKGSICVDGVSLTVNEVADARGGACRFGVNMIPHTLAHTTLGRLDPGDPVNLEVDLVARYLERLSTARS